MHVCIVFNVICVRIFKLIPYQLCVAKRCKKKFAYIQMSLCLIHLLQIIGSVILIKTKTSSNREKRAKHQPPAVSISMVIFSSNELKLAATITNIACIYNHTPRQSVMERELHRTHYYHAFSYMQILFDSIYFCVYV